MSKYHIYVEGKADKKFLQDYIAFLGIQDDFIEIKAIEGKDKLRQNFPIFEINHPDTINVLFLDADENFQKRKEETEKLLSQLNFDVPFFIIPNNSDNGNLETLLQNCINSENQEIFDCWDQYISCMNSKDKGYTVPNDKAKIFAYLEALLSKKDNEKIKEQNRDYLDKNHWNLDSNYLAPLKTFLTNLP